MTFHCSRLSTESSLYSSRAASPASSFAASQLPMAHRSRRVPCTPTVSVSCRAPAMTFSPKAPAGRPCRRIFFAVPGPAFGLATEIDLSDRSALSRIFLAGQASAETFPVRKYFPPSYVHFMALSPSPYVGPFTTTRNAVSDRALTVTTSRSPEVPAASEETYVRINFLGLPAVSTAAPLAGDSHRGRSGQVYHRRPDLFQRRTVFL